MVEFFSTLYMNDGCIGIGSTLHGLLVVPVVDMELVTRTICMEEVRHALFEMDLNKAPRIDGFPTVFFQRAGTL